jgi:hypothetical protein
MNHMPGNLSSFIFDRHAATPIFDLSYSALLLGIVVALTLWDRRYRRKWQQAKARKWPKVSGLFDEGEIVTMRRGRSDAIAGYDVYLGYSYQADGRQSGLYTCFFPTEEEAIAVQERLANRAVVVRVAPGNPKKSRVLDEDLSGFLPPTTRFVD